VGFGQALGHVASGIKHRQGTRLVLRRAAGFFGLALIQDKLRGCFDGN